MRFFIGREPANHVPIGNGRLLATLQQYDGRQTPIDRLCQLYYPTFDAGLPLLGGQGASVLVRDPASKVWYDPYPVAPTRPGLYGESVSIDSTRFVDGCGMYEVLSHKGVIRVRTTTWVPRSVDALVRRIEVGSFKRETIQAEVYPVMHLVNARVSPEGVILSERFGVFLAVTCVGAAEWHAGDLARGLIDGFGNRIPSAWLLDPGMQGKALMLTHRLHREVPPRPAGGPAEDWAWSAPVYQVIGVGGSETEAIANLGTVLASRDCLHAETLADHQAWLGEGATLTVPDPEWQNLWRVSLSLLRTALQADGAPVMVGFAEYQGRVWIRDGIWVVVTLAHTGHHADALRALRRLVGLLRHRPDGNFHFAYDCRTGEPAEHTYENDSPGLLLFGIASCFAQSGDVAVIREFWDLIRTCADWIVANTEPETGMVRACAGIWETFGPHLEEEYEHMVWTSGVSAYGLRQAIVMAAAVDRPAPTERYAALAEALVARITGLAGDGPLPRSLETTQLDASVLLFFTWMPLFDPLGELATRTLAAVEARLVDPCLGGVWRHEDLTTEWGDMRPWCGPTLWLAEMHLVRGAPDLAWPYLAWINDHRSHCGLVPELMFSHDIARGIGMPSYSQSGVLMVMLRHFRDGGRPPAHWPAMGLDNVPDGQGGRRSLRLAAETAGG